MTGPEDGPIVRPSSSRPGPFVAMMDTAHSGNPNDLRLWRGTLGDGPTQRRFLRQGVVSAIFMIVREVFGQQPSGMPLIKDEHVIHQVSATAFDPALRDPILPGTLERRSDGLDAHVFDRDEHLAIERGVPIQDEIPGRSAVGKRLPKLLTDPRRGGMFGDISSKNLATGMADHEEDVEQ